MSGPERRRRGGCGLLPVVLIACLAAGTGLGLSISWWLWPVEYTDVSPDTLRPAHRLEYITLIAQAYAYDRDLRRAQVRLAALGDLAAMGLEVANLAEQQAAGALSGDASLDVGRIQALAALAYALGHRRSTLAAYLPGGPGYVPGATSTPTWTPWPTATPLLVSPTASPTSSPTSTVQPATVTPISASPTPSRTSTVQPTATPVPISTRRPTGTPTRLPSPTTTATPTRTLTPTFTPTSRPTWTPTPRPVVPRYELVEQRRVCPVEDDQPARDGELRITVLDAAGQPQPNVELLIRWAGGEDRAYTGLKPEKGVGYADFDLEVGQSYQVGVIGTESDVAQGIVADECSGAGSAQIASWEVVFQLSDGALSR